MIDLNYLYLCYITITYKFYTTDITFYWTTTIYKKVGIFRFKRRIKIKVTFSHRFLLAYQRRTLLDIDLLQARVKHTDSLQSTSSFRLQILRRSSFRWPSYNAFTNTWPPHMVTSASVAIGELSNCTGYVVFSFFFPISICFTINFKYYI